MSSFTRLLPTTTDKRATRRYVMPSHEGRFNHMHTLVDAGHVVRLALPLLDGDVELAGVRSTVNGTLAAAIDSLKAATAEYDVVRLEGRAPSTRFFKGAT